MSDLEALIRRIIREEIAAATPMRTIAERTESSVTVEYVDDKTLAKILGLSREALKQMRKRGDGPPYVRVARRAIRYSVADAKSWLAIQQRG